MSNMWTASGARFQTTLSIGTAAVRQGEFGQGALQFGCEQLATARKNREHEYSQSGRIITVHYLAASEPL